MWNFIFLKTKNYNCILIYLSKCINTKQIFFFIFQAIALATLVAISTAQNPRNVPIPSRALQVPQYVQVRQNPALSYSLQVPRTDPPVVPFYNTDTVIDMQPPPVSNQKTPIFYEYPEPSVDLQAPTEGSWNPNNDPNLYYDNAPILVELETPTNAHPKKFNKDAHEKKYTSEAKKEIVLKPVTADELSQLQKTVSKLAKTENQKEVQKEKVSKKSKKPKKNRDIPVEPEASPSHFHDNTIEDISATMIHSLGVNASPGERFQFHMHGHKGPNSYKWGFDTGKG